MYPKKELTCRSRSVIATPSNKAERVRIGGIQRSKSYCWVQESSRVKENEIVLMECSTFIIKATEYVLCYMYISKECVRIRYL